MLFNYVNLPVTTGFKQIKAIKAIKAFIRCLIALIVLIVCVVLISLDPVTTDKLKQLDKFICDRTHRTFQAVGSKPIRSN